MDKEKSKTHVLLVEYDVFLANIYEKKFELEGFKTSVADNGEKGLTEAKRKQPDIILLDNMRVGDVTKAVKLRKESKINVLLESSGGIHLHNVKAYARTGVDRISIGELTHSRQAIDFSLDIIR